MAQQALVIKQVSWELGRNPAFEVALLPCLGEGEGALFSEEHHGVEHS